MDKQKKIRVLIADDSFFMREILIKLLGKSEDIEVVGEAKTGKEVIDFALKLLPDVITMDFNMPFCNGAEATKAILEKANPRPAIIMVSAFTKDGAQETLDSLCAGAVDVIEKPEGGPLLDIDQIADELIGKIKNASRAHVVSGLCSLSTHLGSSVAEKIVKKPYGNPSKKLVLIGASTGGPPVIEEILSHIKSPLSAGVLIVQHMPPHFTKSFAERLHKHTHFNVKEAEEGDFITDDTVYVAPGDFHMEIRRAWNNGFVIHLTDDLPVEGMRPSVDVLFESVAKRFDGEVIAVELTGMGHDGLNGMKALKNSDSYLIAQNPSTAVLTSMPEAIIDAGLQDNVLSPKEIASYISLNFR